jgi:DNA-binding LacI/PurR family transcriptional regulator
MAPTIKDVAASAGFSIATVSRAINTPHTVSPLTLDKIRAAIAALQFRPNALGRQLRAVRTRLVGVVLPTLANPVFAECLQGIDEAADADGYRLILMTTQYDTERENRAIETLREQRVDGLIVTVADADANPLLDTLDQAGLPYVLAHNDTRRRPSVSVDNRGAARDGVRRLLGARPSAHLDAGRHPGRLGPGPPAPLWLCRCHARSRPGGGAGARSGFQCGPARAGGAGASERRAAAADRAVLQQ